MTHGIVKGRWIPSESAHSDSTDPVRLWKADVAAGRIQEASELSLLRRAPRALAALDSFVGDPVRDRLTLPQSLDVLWALGSPPSGSKAGLLHATISIRKESIIFAFGSSLRPSVSRQVGCMPLSDSGMKAAL